MQMHEHHHSISIKMAAPLETCTREEQHSVIRFLRSEGVKPIEIHRRMKVQYGDACLSQQQVYECSRKFANGVTPVEDAPRPGQASFWSITHLEGPRSPTKSSSACNQIKATWTAVIRCPFAT